MKITVETEDGTCQRVLSDGLGVQQYLNAFADCMAGVSYLQYEFTVEEEDA